MHVLERWSIALRHSRWLDHADWLWNRVRPHYNRMTTLLGRNGLARTINGTDSIRVLPRYRGVGETYEPLVWNHLMAGVRPGDVVVDVGAFIGLYTVALAKRLRPGGKVVAFEPDAENFAILQAHVAVNCVADRVELIQAAVGARSGAVPFEAGRSSESCIRRLPGGTRLVPCVRLDDVFSERQVDVVKIDVEGYEEEVLSGAIDLLNDRQRGPRIIYVEVHPYAWPAVGTTSASLLRLLARCGYRVLLLDGQPVERIDSWGEIVACRNGDSEAVPREIRLTSSPEGKSPLPRAARGACKRGRLGSRILYVQYTNPAAYPPLEHSSRILAREGWRILFLGADSLGAGALRFAVHPNIAVRQLSLWPAGWRQKLHYTSFCLWVAGWAVRWQPHWVYASGPLSCPIALALSTLPGLRVIYHEHDSPNPVTAALGTRQSPFMRLVMWTRRRLLRRATLCVFPNGQRAERAERETGATSRTLCVWNCPARDEVSAARPPLESEDLWILYHGSIVPSRLPLSVLSALALLPETVKLRVIGYETVGHKGYVRQLREMASGLAIGERVQFVGTVPDRAELLEWCGKSDVGLALMPKVSQDINELMMTGASNKPFDYLACGVPLLVSELPEWRAMYVDPGYGRACDPDDPGSIATAFRWFLEHPDEARRMGERGRQRVAAEWNYETQFARVLERMNGRGAEA